MLESDVTNLARGTDVLVVEDDPRVRKMLADAMRQMGFLATFAPDADVAAKALAGRTFDVLILDLNLPGMGGIEFLETIRRKHNDVPTIILTGFGDLDAARKAIHLDVTEFLTKPCTLGTLEAAMARAAAKRRKQIVGDAAADPRLTLAPARPAPVVPVATADNAAASSMEDVERRHILGVLQKHGGNRAATAAELGISVRKLYYRLGEWARQGLIGRDGGAVGGATEGAS